jgi:outer membrane protein TolC
MSLRPLPTAFRRFIMRSTLIVPRFPRLALAFALLLCGMAPAAFAAPEALTLEQSLQLALARSRQLAGIDSAVSAARDMAVAARQLPDPVIKFGVDNLPVSGPDRFSLSSDFMTMRRIGVSQELTRAGTRERRSDAYQRVAGKALAEKDAATAAIERDTALAWLDSYFLQELARLVAAQVLQAEQEITASEGAYRGAKGSLADVLAARSALAMAHDRASEAARRAASAATVLARWIGDQAARPLAPPPALDAIPLDMAALELQLARHPQLAVLERQVDAALAELRSAEAARKPDWSVELAFQQRGPGYANMVSIGASVPLQWDRKNRQDREVAARAALAGQARAERDEAQRTQVMATRLLIEEWRNGRERIARFDRELLPLAAQRVAAVLSAYRGGKASLADVLAARRDETAARVQALELGMANARLWAQLNYLLPRGVRGGAQ